MAAIAHELAERETREAAGDYPFQPLVVRTRLSLIAVAHAHRLFNQFPDQPLMAMLGTMVVAPLAIMAIFRFGTSEAQHWLQLKRASTGATLEALRAGRLPEDADREEDRGARPKGRWRNCKRMREYWELQAWLVHEAEETMLEEAAGDAQVRPGADPRRIR